MFELECDANLKSVKLSVREKDGVTVRRCQMVLEREFDDLIAAALGKGAKKVLSGLRDGETEKVVMPIAALACSADLRARKDKVSIGSVSGIKATGKRSPDEDEDVAPTIELEFEFTFDEAAWAFLGRNCGAVATITMQQRQQELSAA